MKDDLELPLILHRDMEPEMAQNHFKVTLVSRAVRKETRKESC